MQENRNDKCILKGLRQITKNPGCWKENIYGVAEKLDNDYSIEVKAKALWLLGEIGLKNPVEIDEYVEDIVGFLEDSNPKLRERSVNAIGRIGRANKNLIIPYFDELMEMRHDEFENVRHAFIWACENIAINAPELFFEKLDIFYGMISDLDGRFELKLLKCLR